MPHVPSQPDEIAQRILARFTAISGADTANLNGDIATLIGVVAEELSLADRRFYEFSQAHYFNTSGDLLLERIKQLPAGFKATLEATLPRGGNFTFTRSLTTNAQTYGVGTIRVADSYDSTKQFTNAEPVYFGAGVASVSGYSVVGTTPGSKGSSAAGAVRVVVSSPDGNIIGCNNYEPVIGLDAETESELKIRAAAWMAATTLCTGDAIREVALSFVSPTTGQRYKHAEVFRDPDRPGYTECVVSDGTAMVGISQTAQTYSGVLPPIGDNERWLLNFDFPALEPPNLKIGNVTYHPIVGRWTAIEELGEMWVAPWLWPTHTRPQPGDTWSITGHQVAKPGLFVELQDYLNRYCCVWGQRVRVMRAIPQYVTIEATIVVDPTLTIFKRQDVIARAKEVTETFIADIPIGKPLINSDLNIALRRIAGIVNVIFSTPDKYPGSPRHKLVAGTINYT